MKSCTFFGHRDVSEKIGETLTPLLIELIKKGVDMFYVGSQGNFDYTVIKTLKLLKIKYPHISYYIVLAYLPVKEVTACFDYKNTLYPEGLEAVPPKYAIIERNKWMIDKSDCVIVYVNQPSSNTAKFKAISEKKGKIVINIAD